MQNSRPHVGIAAVALLLTAAAAPAQGTGTQWPTPLPAPPSLLAKFDATAGTVQQLDVTPVANGDYAIPIVLGGKQRTLLLSEHDVRAPDFQLLVQDANGVRQVPTPPCTTFRGSLLEDARFEVVASIVDGSVEAVVYAPAQEADVETRDWVVQPIRRVSDTAGPSAHVVYLMADSAVLPGQCGTGFAPAPPPVPPGNVPSVGLDTTRLCDIAIEADLQFYQLNGSSVVATQNDVTAVMNQIDFIYDRDCNISYNVTTILVTTINVYTTNDANALLTQFASRWNTVNAGILRDVAHLFTGRSLNGSTIGIAQLASVCVLGSAYGLSQSRFSGNFGARVGLTSHELGHCWSAQHCDGINPCYIMCASLGGCSNNVALFAPVSINQISQFAATRTCLSVAQVPPTILSATPNIVPVFAPGNVVLGGSGFTGATSYEINSQQYTSGFTVPNDKSMSIAVPQGTATGLATVRVNTPLGTSNAYPLIYQITSPPKLRTTTTVPNTGGIATFDFGGTPGREWLFVIGFFNQTTPFQGFPLLSSPLLLTAGVFSAPLGIEGFSVPVPGGLGPLIIYSQILEADSTPAATGVSNIGVTILL